MDAIRHFFHELQRRRVLRVAVAYAAIGWLTIEVASLFEDALELPGWTDRLVIVLLFLGFPIAMVLTWIFDVTATGIRRTEELQRTADGRGQAPSATPVPPVIDGETASVCVLAFEDLSPEPGHGILAAGLATEIHNALGRMHRLRVISRRSALRFSGSGDSIEDIASELNVRYVISGSLMRAGNRVRVIAELDDAETGTQIWTGKFDRDLDDLFGAQAEIAEAIVSAFGVQRTRAELSAARSAPTGSLDAWTLVQRARVLLLDHSREALEDARGLLEKGISLDPRYAAANAIYGSVLAERVLNGYSDDDAGDCRKALESVDVARRLAPQDPFVLKMVGMVRAYCGDAEGSLQALRSCVELAPFDFGAWGYLGWPLVARAGARDLEELHSVVDRLLATAPEHPGVGYWLYHKSAACQVGGDLESADRLMHRSLDRNPHMSWGYLHLASLCGAMGRPDLARTAVDAAVQINPAMTPAHFAACLQRMAAGSESASRRIGGLLAAGLLESQKVS